MKSVCVYCASSSLTPDSYKAVAQQFGQIIAENKLTLINGAGDAGLMAELSNSTLAHGGEVIGFIPRFMCEVDWQHKNLTRLEITETMHERKEKMIATADFIVAFPGGCGTMEELLEAITWKQLGIIDKPIVILNIDGFYDPLMAQIRRAIGDNLMRKDHLNLWTEVNKAEDILSAAQHPHHFDNNLRSYAKI